MLKSNITGAGKPQLLFKLIEPLAAHQHLKQHHQQRKGRKRSGASTYNKLFIKERAPRLPLEFILYLAEHSNLVQ